MREARIASGLEQDARQLAPGVDKEDRRPARVVGGDALLRVVALEEPLLQFALEREALFQPDLEPGGHRAPDEAELSVDTSRLGANGAVTDMLARLR
jgi:hypothetical protein